MSNLLANPRTSHSTTKTPLVVRKFRSTERHPEAQRSALKRFETSLIQKEKQKQLDEEEFKAQVAHNQAYSQMLKEKVKNDQKLNREFLLSQMKENRLNRLKEAEDKHKYFRTNYGPEETDYTYAIHNLKKEGDKNMLQQELGKQVNNKQMLKTATVGKAKNLDQAEELKMLKRDKEAHDQIKKEEEEVKKVTIQENVKNWELQDRLRKKKDKLLYV